MNDPHDNAQTDAQALARFNGQTVVVYDWTEDSVAPDCTCGAVAAGRDCLATCASRAELREGLEVRLEVPARTVVCSRCNGQGHHTNPSIDGHGIGAEEWAEEWTDEERGAYLSGAYDVRCATCEGQRTRLVPDWSRMTEAQIAAAEDHYASEAADAAEAAAERRAGA